MNISNSLRNTGSAVKEVASGIGSDVRKLFTSSRPKSGLTGALKNKMGKSSPKILGSNIGGFIKRQQDLKNY